MESLEISIMYSCLHCAERFTSILRYNQHHKSHQNLPVTCLHSTCQKTLKNYSSFKRHNLRFHDFPCKYTQCNFRCSNVQALRSHYKLHAAASVDSFICSFCVDVRSFKSKNALNVHISTLHNDVVDEDQSKVREDESEAREDQSEVREDQSEARVTLNFQEDLCPTNFEKSLSLDSDAMDTNNNECSVNILDEKGTQLQEFGMYELQSCIPKSQSQMENLSAAETYAKLYLQMATKHFATNDLIQSVSESTNAALRYCTEKFVGSIMSSDLPDNIKKDVLNKFSDGFTEIAETHDSKTGMFRSAYSRKKFWCQNFQYIQPLSIPLQNQDKENTDCKYSYVPILETLKTMLMNDDVRNHCLGTHKNNDSQRLFDIGDGKVIKNNAFFSTNPSALRINLFQDAFEVCNPLGSSKTEFKLIGIYMVVANLPPYLLSKTENIKLVLLCHDKYVGQFGWNSILRTLIDDLKVLESTGISLTVNDKIYTFIGSLVAVLGDNLGSHQIGGFVENFSSAKYWCRYCEISALEFHTNPSDRKQNRTIQSYEDCVSETLKKGGIEKGVKSNSPLNELEHFHVCNIGLPPCLAHDLFEGIVAYDMLLVVQYFVNMKWFR